MEFVILAAALVGGIVLGQLVFVPWFRCSRWHPLHGDPGGDWCDRG